MPNQNQHKAYAKNLMLFNIFYRLKQTHFWSITRQQVQKIEIFCELPYFVRFQTPILPDIAFKGTVAWDFLVWIFFMNQ